MSRRTRGRKENKLNCAREEINNIEGFHRKVLSLQKTIIILQAGAVKIHTKIYNIINKNEHYTPYTHLFIPKPLPTQVLYTVRSSASSLNFQYTLFSLRLSSSCLRLLPPLPIIPSLCLSFNNVFQRVVPTQDVTKPVSLPSFYCIWDIHFSLSRSK